MWQNAPPSAMSLVNGALWAVPLPHCAQNHHCLATEHQLRRLPRSVSHFARLVSAHRARETAY